MSTKEEAPTASPSDQGSGSDKLYDVSFSTSPEELALLQQAGDAVGLQVAQVSVLLHSSGTEIPIREGRVGVRYMTGNADLINTFNAKVTELRALSQQAPSAQG